MENKFPVLFFFRIVFLCHIGEIILGQGFGVASGAQGLKILENMPAHNFLSGLGNEGAQRFGDKMNAGADLNLDFQLNVIVRRLGESQINVVMAHLLIAFAFDDNLFFFFIKRSDVVGAGDFLAVDLVVGKPFCVRQHFHPAAGFTSSLAGE